MNSFLKPLITIVFFVFMLLASASVMAQTTLDQSFIAPNNLGADINEGAAFVAQTFTAGLTGTLAGVNIDVTSPTNSPFFLHVAIRTVTGNGEPSSTILSETTLNSNSAPLSLLITFPQVITIVAGEKYAIAVNYPGAVPGTGQSQGIWAGAPGDFYPAGDLFFSIDGSSWVPSSLGDHDVHFQTFVTIAEATFDICLQDDSTRDTLTFNSVTGQYQFTRCAGSILIGGTGTVITRGSIVDLKHTAADRRVTARIDRAANRGSASIQVLSQGVIFTIADRNISNNTCSCP